jgi:glycosyltransferase involved in cell wall biosynthesis
MAGLPSDAVVVLYQGWISAERNLTTLVKAAEFFPTGTYLVVIGYGAHEADLRAVLVDQPWAEKVRFLGRVEPDQILPLTAGADVGVIPYQPIDLNHTLCSPNKFFEYVQSGVPVVAHDLIFFRGMKEKYGVVEVGDLSTPQGMAKAINALAGDADRLNRMRDACARAAEELNWEVESRKLLAVYPG